MTHAHALTANEVSLAYGNRAIVNDLSVEIPPGQITVIVGANACGKSTLLRGLSRLLKPSSGSVLLDGTDIHTLPTARVAQVLGLLPQSPVAPETITVGELVARGRYPHQSWLRRRTSGEDVIVDEAMRSAGVLEIAHRGVDELSGGQRQRVWIAMALAQQTDLLLLDEPTTYLDISHQIDVLDLLAEQNERDGTTIVMVLHELTLAFRYADHIIAMRDGAIVAAGAPADIVDAEMIRRVFDVDALVVPDPASGTPLVTPFSRRRATGGSVDAQRSQGAEAPIKARSSCG